MNASLVMVKPDGTTREARLKPGRSIIGRDEGCTVRIPAAEVSRSHCELNLDEQSLSVRDLGSSNGTFINADQLDKDQPRSLEAGDVLSVGSFRFVVRIDGDPEQVTAEMLKSPGATEPSDNNDASDSLPASLLAELGGSDDDSSIVDFDFDLSDDDEPSKPL